MAHYPKSQGYPHLLLGDAGNAGTGSFSFIFFPFHASENGWFYRGEIVVVMEVQYE
jgi:hypothetical protein